jgi:hypothetical protein
VEVVSGRSAENIAVFDLDIGVEYFRSPSTTEVPVSPALRPVDRRR